MALAKTRFNDRGNATLEAAVSLPVVLLGFVLMMSGLYGVFLQSVLHQQTYEYLLCAEFSATERCEIALKQKLKTAMPWGHWKILTPPPENEIRRIKIQFSLSLDGNHQWNWDYQNQIRRDLSSSSF
jgi:hypothetical protein